MTAATLKRSRGVSGNHIPSATQLKRLITVSLVLVCTLLTSSLTAGARKGVRHAKHPIAGQYIVTLARNDDPEAVGLETASLYGGKLKHVYNHAVRGFAVRLTPAQAAALADDPRVSSVEEDDRIQTSDIEFTPPWGLDRIDQRVRPVDGQYEYPTSSTPVYVDVIDTGILTTHSEFSGRAIVGADYVTPSTGGIDCNGHGTHVAGTIGGNTYGVAKNVTLVAYRALDCTGNGSSSAVLAAIDAITADTVHRPAVVNMSLGGPANSTLDDAVRRSIASGVTYVVAAGNSNVDASTQSPADVTEAITVGATDAADTRASFSNYGPALDLFAPGVSILSAYYTSTTSTKTLSGTSMATPHVAGAAALYLQQHPTATPAEVRNALVAAATPGVVTSPGSGSPNALLYSGFMNTTTTPPPSTSRTNVALSSNGATALASSTYGTGFGASAVINGDRKGTGWGTGGVWVDGTAAVFPDWVEVDFKGTQSISEIDIFGVQDNNTAPIAPTTAMISSKYGLTAFDVQYWDGAAWAPVPGGRVTGNSLVWRTFTFAPISTQRIRVVVNSASKYSRVAEIEAYTDGGTATTPPPLPPPTTSGTNVALSVNGGSAIASSVYGTGFSAMAVIDGDRRGAKWGTDGVWVDGTPTVFPDWIEVDFNGPQTIGTVNVFGVQDNNTAPVEPTTTMTFSKYGLTAFDVQYWNGTAWVRVPGGQVTGNNLIWRTVAFAPVTTQRIRVVVNSAVKYSRVTEIEAFTN